MSAFLSSFVAEQPPFRVDSDVYFTAGSAGYTTEARFFVGGAISNEDFRGKVSIEGSGSVEVILLDGTAYARLPGGRWSVDRDFVATQPLNPFTLLEADDLQYLGTVRRNRRGLHRLQTSRWIGGPLEVPELTDIELVHSEFDIYVDDRGLPVEAVLVFAITGRLPNSATATFDYEVLYFFSKVGKPVKIKAPI